MQFWEIGLIALLATYRWTLMLNNETGPGEIFARFRYWLGVRYDTHSNPYGTNWRAEAILCPYCLSVWVATFISAALVLGLLFHVLEGVLIILLPFALSGGVVYLKKMGG